jgi:hypothetical protein
MRTYGLFALFALLTLPVGLYAKTDSGFESAYKQGTSVFYRILTETMSSVPPTRWTGYLLAAGMRWAVDNGADIINLSVALRGDMPAVREAARYCWENNVLLVTPMGNARAKEDRTILYFPLTILGRLRLVERNKRGILFDRGIGRPLEITWTSLPPPTTSGSSSLPTGVR